MDRHKRTIRILLILALLIPCTGGCAVIQRSHFWQSDTANTEIVKTRFDGLIFRHGDVDLEVSQLGGYYVPYFFGPPFIPIFPLVLLHPWKKYLHAQIAFDTKSRRYYYHGFFQNSLSIPRGEPYAAQNC